MKLSFIAMLLAAGMLNACGTIGGAMSGAGQDLSKAGEWIKSK